MKTLISLMLLISPILAQDLVVPSDSCSWRGAQFGVEASCEPNEIAVGACGSGEDDNCGTGIWHALLCCEMPNYFWQNCIEHRGSHGENLSCPFLTHDPNMLVESQCGSGKNSDCEDHGHSVKCCHGVFTDGGKLGNTHICYWLYGHWGEELECQRNDEAVFGRCGSGKNDDCGNDVWHGIECCQITKIEAPATTTPTPATTT
eukprot:maker-scaffold825_size91437-snap-gene-0.15 protein:Tk05919 transcript:maker-scaffold825_size91437-snap-gene-0.15-mRNA-1 annotation:"unnamed protein product"